jgi:TolA-binding protein
LEGRKMSRTTLIFTTIILTVGLVIVLADEPNDINIDESIDYIVDSNSTQPANESVRPIVLFRQLNQKIERLERQVAELVKDNRQQKAEIKNYENRIQRLESFHKITPAQPRSTNGTNEPYKSRRRTITIQKKSGRNSID